MTETELTELVEARRTSRSGRGRELRIAAGLSQAEVADFCGTARSTVGQWESGRRAPRGEAALRYARLIRRISGQAAS
jgi:transcriptional regulator with XRE-family HTH domain